MPLVAMHWLSDLWFGDAEDSPMPARCEHFTEITIAGSLSFKVWKSLRISSRDYSWCIRNPNLLAFVILLNAMDYTISVNGVEGFSPAANRSQARTSVSIITSHLWLRITGSGDKRIASFLFVLLRLTPFVSLRTVMNCIRLSLGPSSVSRPSSIRVAITWT